MSYKDEKGGVYEMSKMLLLSIFVGIVMIVAAVLFTSQPTQAFDPMPGCFPCEDDGAGDCPCGARQCLYIFGFVIVCWDCPPCQA
jgi:hypothetical protein